MYYVLSCGEKEDRAAVDLGRGHCLAGLDTCDEEGKSQFGLIRRPVAAILSPVSPSRLSVYRLSPRVVSPSRNTSRFRECSGDMRQDAVSTHRTYVITEVPVPAWLVQGHTQRSEEGETIKDCVPRADSNLDPDTMIEKHSYPGCSSVYQN